MRMKDQVGAQIAIRLQIRAAFTRGVCSGPRAAVSVSPSLGYRAHQSSPTVAGMRTELKNCVFEFVA
jgi:hypothetical protein